MCNLDYDYKQKLIYWELEIGEISLNIDINLLLILIFSFICIKFQGWYGPVLAVIIISFEKPAEKVKDNKI